MEREAWSRLLEDRNGLSEAEWATLLRRMREDDAAAAAVAAWLRLDEHLSQALAPERRDFPNRLRVALADQHSGRFIRRLAGATRQPRRWLRPAVALAAMLVLATGLALWRPWEPASPRLSDGTTWRPGTTLVGGPAGLSVAWPDGTTVQLAAQSTARLEEGGRRTQIDLLEGTASAVVAPQGPAASFAIAAPHLKAQVHGTGFQVACDAVASLVTVDSGVVAVRCQGEERLLHAGEAVVAEAGGFSGPVAPAVRWDDRRPLISVQFANTIAGCPGNPRGWFVDAALDVRTAEGRASLRTRLLAAADEANANARRAGAQGIIVWGLEGWHAGLLYPGDPRRLADLAPEMDAVADEFFARLAAGGLATGLVVKPWPARRDQGVWRWRSDDVDLAADLVDKLAYAQRRWGCTLAFLGHNYASPAATAPGDPLLPAAPLAAVRRALPDMRLIAELSSIRSAPFAASWRRGADLRDGTPRPRGPQVITADLGTGPLPPALTAALRDGAILLFADDPQAAARVGDVYRPSPKSPQP